MSSQSRTIVTSKPGRLPIQVTKSTSPSAIQGVATTITKAFMTDPITTYMLNHVPWHLRRAAMYHMHIISTTGARHHGLLYEASVLDDPNATPASPPTASKYHAAAVVFPPGHNLDNMSHLTWTRISLSRQMLLFLWYCGVSSFVRKSHWNTAVEPAKRAALPNGETYFYVMEIGTDERFRGKGLAPALIADVQVAAQQAMKPIWLEASNLGARAVYTKCGFVDVDVEIVVGKGECDATGEQATGDEAVGVKLWPMIWRPEGYKKV